MIGVSSSFKIKDTNLAMEAREISKLLTCNPPILTFDGVSSPSILCSNTYYDVRILGTANATITSITGGTLYGKNGDDFPTNWRIRTGNSGSMTIQVWGQCSIFPNLVNSSTATYSYTVLFSGGLDGMCNK